MKFQFFASSKHPTYGNWIAHKKIRHSAVKFRAQNNWQKNSNPHKITKTFLCILKYW